MSDRLGRRTPILISLGVIGPAVYLLTLVPNELLVVPLAIFGLAFSKMITLGLVPAMLVHQQRRTMRHEVGAGGQHGRWARR